MKIYEYFSYKTFYYFLKDISNLNLSNYKRIKDENDFKLKKKFTTAHLDDCFDLGRIGTKDLIILKTNKGYFIYHYIDDHEYVKEFLKQNSLNASCGVFGSYRTSDVYMMGIADKGNIIRYVYSDEEGDIVEGEPTTYEKQGNLDLSVGDDGYLNNFLNEEDVFEYAKWFMGFDIENQDVKILDILHYTPCTLNGNLPLETAKVLAVSMIKQKVEELGIMFSYNTKTKILTISCQYIPNPNNVYNIYCDNVYSIKDKEEFILSLNRCIQACITFDLHTDHKTMSNVDDYYHSINNKDYNIALCVIDIEKKFLIGISLFQKKGKRLPQNMASVLKGGLLYNLSKNDILEIYKIVKKLVK